MDTGTIHFKNGRDLVITESAARTVANALNSYWEKPDGAKRVVSAVFSADGGVNNRSITVDLESVMFVITK